MIDSSKISLNFIKKLEYTGGYQGMRYMLRKESRDEDTVLTAYAWPEPFCFPKQHRRKRYKKNSPLPRRARRKLSAG